MWKGNTAHRTYKGRLVAPGFSSRNTRIVTKADPSGTIVSAALGVRKEAFYAVQFIERELGRSKHTAQPSLRAAMASTQNEQQAALAAKLRERIDKVVPK
jgi:predicted transcriptional regulator